MYYRPADWHARKTLWLAWPWDASLWGSDLALCQQEFLALINALREENVVIVCPDEAHRAQVWRALDGQKDFSCLICPYADIWLRDTLPIVVKDSNNNNVSMCGRFNGWGGKYLFEDDLSLNERMAHLWGFPVVSSAMVFEGGSLEFDGYGTLLTTTQCLQNKNRNPSWSKKDIEQELTRLFGAQKIIWLKEGLKNDHTDGHIDTLARFIAPGVVVIMQPQDIYDPNYEVLMAIKEQLMHERDAQGNRLKIIELPSPGGVLDKHGHLMPASYVNFIRGDHTLVIPTYGVPADAQAVAIMQTQVPSMRVVGLSAKAILAGGGAFHCISQEVWL